MGILDKTRELVKDEAHRVSERAHAEADRQRERILDLQVRHRTDAMLHDLGRSYYEHLRHDGSEAAVWEALAQLDAYLADHPQPQAGEEPS